MNANWRITIMLDKNLI